jgi:glycerophosphoryl diester phosphodiesterase
MHSVRPALPSLRPAGRRPASDILRIAHRGGAAGAEDYRPRNLRRIARLGTHLVEVDLRTTRDGRFVAYHDPTVSVDGAKRGVGEHTLAEWRELLPDERMPLAEAVLAAVHDAGLGLYLDIKDVTGTGATQLGQLLAAARMTEKTILAAVDPATVALLSQVSNAVPRAVLFRDRDEDPIRLARLARADFVHPCWEDEDRPDRLLSPAWLDTVRAQGLGVVCWHEERPDVLTSLRGLGVDGICTDDPALLTEILRR